MARESCIAYPAESVFLMVRAPLIAICEMSIEGEDKKPAPDPQAAAIILHQFIYWTDGKLSNQHQSRYFAAAAESEGETNQQDNGLWIYKDYDELKLDLLDLFGRNKIIDNVQWLVSTGYLKRRTNPRYRWDKTLQYAVDVDLVQSRIDALPSFKIKPSTVSNQTTEQGKNKRAIPENTTENTKTEKKKKTTSVPVGTGAVVFPETTPGKPVPSKATKKPATAENLKTGQSDAKDITTPPPPVAPAPSPVKTPLQRVIDDAWNGGVVGSADSVPGVSVYLIPQLMGNSKAKGRKDYNITPASNEREIYAFGKWYRAQMPNIPLPTDGEKLAMWFARFRTHAEYESRVRDAEYDVRKIYHPDTPAPVAADDPSVQPATEEHYASIALNIANLAKAFEES